MTQAQTFDVVDFIVRVEGDMIEDPTEYIEGLAYLYRSGIYTGLQGSWQRAILNNVDAGYIDAETGEVSQYARDVIAGRA